MIRRPPRSTRPDTLFPFTTLFRANPWLLELVAGLIDKDEEPEEVARREAIEEANLTLTSLWPITQYYPSPGGSDERVHLFIGRCDSEGAGGVHELARSEEHTSELQSLMRSSYAVFCLKKKNI